MNATGLRYRPLRKALPMGAFILLMWPTPSAEAQAGWEDPSPHRSISITVDTAVHLDVLDWGGTGPAMLFIPGLGNTAHAYDSFAPRYRDAYHVYAITPRGFGSSSFPPAGYDSPARVRERHSCA